MARNFNYTKIEWQDGTILQPAKVTVQGTEYEVEPEVKSGQTPIDAINLDKMDSAIETIIEEELPSVINVELLAVTDVAPTECSTGDKYYNTEDKKIYTATGEDTWSSTGEDPLDGILYVLFDKRNTFAWDGTDLISVGGGGGVYVGTEPPEDDNVNFWINPDDNMPYIEDFATVLWTNPSPSSEFAQQVVTLNDDLDNYTYLEIISRQSTGSGNIISSGKMPIEAIALTTYLPIHYNMYRNFITTTKTFKNNVYFSSYGNVNSTTSDNSYNIPYMILGYK